MWTIWQIGRIEPVIAKKAIIPLAAAHSADAGRDARIAEAYGVSRFPAKNVLRISAASVSLRPE